MDPFLKGGSIVVGIPPVDGGVLCLDIYARVSSDDQNVDQQVAYLKAWLNRNGYRLGRVVADTESGRIPLIERKKFWKLLEEGPKSNSKGVAVYNLDRLTRNWDDVTEIERRFRGHWATYRLVSASDPIDLSSASGRLMFRIRMATSCYMPEDMREKQVIGIERAKKEGKYKYGRGRPKPSGGALQRPKEK